MQELERILEEIRRVGSIRFANFIEPVISVGEVEKIIRKHMNAVWIPVKDLSRCEIELKPCPFCGCGAEMFTRGGRYTARCRSCFCGTGEYKDPGRASESWNRRADDEQNNRQ